MPSKYSTKFQLKPSVWVFVPTLQNFENGKLLKLLLERRWKAPKYYFHLKKGGHVEALKSHLNHNYFLHLDIENFFGSINKTRVTRNLKKFFSYEKARELANNSTVTHPETKTSILPFGFVQSPLIASICLENSALGSYLNQLHKKNGIDVSVYVDDIVVSSNDESVLSEIKEKIIVTAKKSLFSLNDKKTEGPSIKITAFNIELSNQLLNLSQVRMNEFKLAYDASESENQRDGILGYVNTVNHNQSKEFS